MTIEAMVRKHFVELDESQVPVSIDEIVESRPPLRPRAAPEGRRQLIVAAIGAVVAMILLVWATLSVPTSDRPVIDQPLPGPAELEEPAPSTPTTPASERVGGTLSDAGWRYVDLPPVDLAEEDTFIYRISDGRWVAGQARSCPISRCRIWISSDLQTWQPGDFVGVDDGQIGTITASQGALWATLTSQQDNGESRALDPVDSVLVSHDGVFWQRVEGDLSGMLEFVTDFDDLVVHHFGDALQAYLLRRDEEILLVHAEGAPLLSANDGTTFRILSDVPEELREWGAPLRWWWGWVDSSGYHLAGRDAVASSVDGEAWELAERSGEFPFPTRNMYSLADNWRQTALSRRGLLDLPLIVVGEQVIVPTPEGGFGTSEGGFARTLDGGMSWDVDEGPHPFELDRVAVHRNPDTGASWFIVYDENAQQTWVSSDATVWYSTPGTASSWRAPVPFDAQGMWVPPA